MVFVEYTNNIFKIDLLNLSEIESLTKQKLNITDFYFTTSGKIVSNNTILKDNCVDTGCSLKIFNKKTFLSFDYFDGMHRFLPALFKTAKKKIVFVNVNHRPRIYGISKYNNFNRMIKGIKDLIKVYRMIN